LKIGADPLEEACLRKPVTWNPAETVDFMNFRTKPAATPACSQANSMLFSLAAKTRLIM
jgi:hypothetical protein